MGGGPPAVLRPESAEDLFTWDRLHDSLYKISALILAFEAFSRKINALILIAIAGVSNWGAMGYGVSLRFC